MYMNGILKKQEKDTWETYGTATGQSVVDYAMQFRGNPYVWGGESLTNGVDCSGFTMQVYKHFGYSLPHSSTAQRSTKKHKKGGACNKFRLFICIYK